MQDPAVLWRHIASERLLWAASGDGSHSDKEIQRVIQNANIAVGECLYLETL